MSTAVLNHLNTADETSRIQNALDSEGAVLLQPGDWNYTTLSIPDKASLGGAGRRNTTLIQIAGTAEPLLKPAAYGISEITISDLRFTAFLNQASNIGGLLLEGISRSHFRSVGVAGCNDYGIKVAGHGLANTGDAMYNEFFDPVVENLTVNAKMFWLACAADGGSHPDGTRIFGGYFGAQVAATGIYSDGPNVDESGALGPDNLLIVGLNMQGVSILFDLVTQNTTIIGCRCERISIGMNGYIRAGTTNFPTTDTHLIGNTYPSGGLTLTDAGARTILIADNVTDFLTSLYSGAYTNRLRVSGDTADRFRQQVNGRMEWGDGTNAPDTVLYRPLASLLRTEDEINYLGSTLATRTFSANKAGEDAPRWALLLSGLLEMGPGDGSYDYTIGRNSDGHFMLSGLPTTDPHLANALWSNSGVVTVSAG